LLFRGSKFTKTFIKYLYFEFFMEGFAGLVEVVRAECTGVFVEAGNTLSFMQDLMGEPKKVHYEVRR